MGVERKRRRGYTKPSSDRILSTVVLCGHHTHKQTVTQLRKSRRGQQDGLTLGGTTQLRNGVGATISPWLNFTGQPLRHSYLSLCQVYNIVNRLDCINFTDYFFPCKAPQTRYCKVNSLQCMPSRVNAFRYSFLLTHLYFEFIACTHFFCTYICCIQILSSVLRFCTLTLCLISCMYSVIVFLLYVLLCLGSTLHRLSSASMCTHSAYR